MEVTEENQAYLNAASAVLLHQLVEILPRNFSDILHCHRHYLQYNYSTIQIEAIERELETSCDLLHRDSNVKGSFDSLDDNGSFDAAWFGMRSTYPLIDNIFGGLKSTSTSTSTIERLLDYQV